jgi:hypothetical protein
MPGRAALGICLAGRADCFSHRIFRRRSQRMRAHKGTATRKSTLFDSIVAHSHHATNCGDALNRVPAGILAVRARRRRTSIEFYPNPNKLKALLR